MKTSPKKEPQKEFCYTHYLNPTLELHPEFIRFDYNAGAVEFKYKSHRHTDHELIYVDSGIYRARLNKQRIVLPRCHCLLIGPGDLHYDEAKPDLKYYSLSFHIKAVPEPKQPISLFRSGLSCSEHIFSRKCDFIPKLLKETAITIEEQTQGASQLAHILLHELFWRLVQIIPPDNYSTEFSRLSGCNNFATRFYRTMDRNISSTMELNELAKKLAMSSSQLNKQCNRIMNNSPATLVRNYKINRAKELLANSNLSIREISEMLGFKDQFSFSRAFKRLQSIPPRQYRKEAEEKFINQ